MKAWIVPQKRDLDYSAIIKRLKINVENCVYDAVEECLINRHCDREEPYSVIYNEFNAKEIAEDIFDAEEHNYEIPMVELNINADCIITAAEIEIAKFYEKYL